MTWFRVDDSFPEHPKLEAIEGEEWGRCMGVWISAGCYCARHSTDGRISKTRLARITPLGEEALKVARRLVDAGLWTETEDGYAFHDWADYQPTKAELEDAKRIRTERQRRWRAKRRAEKLAKTERVDALHDALQDASRNASRDGPHDALQDASRDGPRDASRDGIRAPIAQGGVDGAPSRPDPSRTLSKERETRGRAKGSLSGLRDPLGEGEVSSEEYPWRKWAAEGRKRGLTVPSHPRFRDRDLSMQLEQLALDAAPSLRETFGTLEEAFRRLVNMAIVRYGLDHDKDPLAHPWKLGWVVSAWAELTKGALPKEAA